MRAQRPARLRQFAIAPSVREASPRSSALHAGGLDRFSSEARNFGTGSVDI